MDMSNISSVITTVMILVLFYYLVRDHEPFCYYLPGAMSGSYKVHTNISTRFDDIVGCDDIKREIKVHLEYFDKMPLSKGWIFEGAPGTGKTMMARAIAGESKLPFIEIIGRPDVPVLIDILTAKYTSCIIFVDEAGYTLRNDKDILLRKLDGLQSNNNKIFLIFTVNSVSSVSGALLRSGRIDKVITFTPPSYNDRVSMFNKLSMNNSSELARMTDGFTYADLSIIPREIEFNRLVYANKFSEQTIIDMVLSKIKSDRKSSKDVLDPSRLSYHEIGHVLISYLIANGSRPNRISINSENGGFSYHKREDETATESELLTDITILLASSVFERHYCGDISMKCKEDFDSISGILENMYNGHMLGYTYYSSKEYHNKVINELLSVLEAKIISIIGQYDVTVSNMHTALMASSILYEKEIIQMIGEDHVNSIKLNINMRQIMDKIQH